MCVAMIRLFRNSDDKNLGRGCKSKGPQRAMTTESVRHPDNATLNGLKEILNDQLRQRALVAHDNRQVWGAVLQNSLLSGERFAGHERWAVSDERNSVVVDEVKDRVD